jgi:hypothetical protein
MGETLIRSDKARLAKLHELLDRLRRGEIVQNRQLQTWLGEQGYKEYEDSWSNTVDQRNLLNGKSGTIIEYEELLKKAILLYNRGEAASQRGRQSARQLHAKAQAAFEKALLYLEEQLSVDPSLQMWLDRHCDFTVNGNLSLDPIGMPRAITSRSLDNLSDGIKTDSKRQCKIRAVETEIERIQNPTLQVSDSDIADKLKKLRSGWK